MAYDNTNSGAMFLEDDKKNPKWPDFNGSIDVDGVEYWISGWKRTSQSGKKFISLSVKPKEPKRREPERERDTPPDDTPW